VRFSAQGKGRPGGHQGLPLQARQLRNRRFPRDQEHRGAALAPATYFQFTHNGKSSTDANTVAQTFGAQSFNGFAVYTEAKKFEKVHLADIDKGKAEYVKEA
jgi:hypothetical protein